MARSIRSAPGDSVVAPWRRPLDPRREGRVVSDRVQPRTVPGTPMRGDVMTRFGLQLPSFTFSDVPDDRMFERVADTAQAAEDSGFDSFWVMDHYHQIRS